MRSGKSVLREIRRDLREARSNAAAASTRVHDLRQQVEAARSEEARCLAKLASVRLGVLAGGAAARRIDEADRAALAVLADRERELERLAREISDGAAALVPLIEERSARLDHRDECAAAYRAQVEATRARLAQEEEYTAQKGHAEFAAGQARNAGAKAEQAEADRDEKRRPYEADPLFSYLWKRRYRFEEYRPYPVIAALDGWVAGLCDYGKAHRDYGLLLEIPVRLRAHADELAARAAAERARVVELEDAALAADGATELQDRLTGAQRDLDAAEQAVVVAEARQDRLCAAEQALNAGRDPFTNRAESLLEQQMANEDVATLRQDALATATDADDELVRAIGRARSAADGVRPQLAAAERDLETANRRVTDVERIERDFRAQDYESSNSVFDDDFDIGFLLGGLLRGSMRRSEVFQQLRRSQSWRSSGSMIGTFGNALGSSGSGFGSFGGFSSGGGFGGGGGGGFSTGGGF